MASGAYRKLRYTLRMTEAARKLLETFDSLPETDRQEVATAILRRAAAVESGDIDDAELLWAADQVFLELDRQETQG